MARTKQVKRVVVTYKCTLSVLIHTKPYLLSHPRLIEQLSRVPRYMVSNHTYIIIYYTDGPICIQKYDFLVYYKYRSVRIYVDGYHNPGYYQYLSESNTCPSSESEQKWYEQHRQQFAPKKILAKKQEKDKDTFTIPQPTGVKFPVNSTQYLRKHILHTKQQQQRLSKTQQLLEQQLHTYTQQLRLKLIEQQEGYQHKLHINEQELNSLQQITHPTSTYETTRSATPSPRPSAPPPAYSNNLLIDIDAPQFPYGSMPSEHNNCLTS